MSLFVSNQMVGKSLLAPSKPAENYVAADYETAGQFAFGGYETAGQVATSAPAGSCSVNTFA